VRLPSLLDKIDFHGSPSNALSHNLNTLRPAGGHIFSQGQVSVEGAHVSILTWVAERRAPNGC
jgi:hypothetical protein